MAYQDFIVEKGYKTWEEKGNFSWNHYASNK